MQTHPQNDPASPQPRVFHYSLDWRFLLPIADSGRIRVVAEEDPDLSQTLQQVGIPALNHFSFSDIKQAGGNNPQVLALPFGLPVRWVSTKQKDQIEFYRSIRHLMEPSGYLLVGFNNAWSSHSKTESKYHPSTPRRVSNELNEAGFKSIKTFGVMPNLNIPEYIFDLKAQAIRFAFHHRFRRKPVAWNILQLLSSFLGWTSASTFLPCYFAVAAI